MNNNNKQKILQDKKTSTSSYVLLSGLLLLLLFLYFTFTNINTCLTLRLFCWHTQTTHSSHTQHTFARNVQTAIVVVVTTFFFYFFSFFFIIQKTIEMKNRIPRSIGWCWVFCKTLSQFALVLIPFAHV